MKNNKRIVASEIGIAALGAGVFFLGVIYDRAWVVAIGGILLLIAFSGIRWGYLKFLKSKKNARAATASSKPKPEGKLIKLPEDAWASRATEARFKRRRCK